MAEKYLLFSLDDDRAKKLGDVISNSTCRKIVNFLAENEASEGEVAKELKIPINTVEYNLKKLLLAGIIEKDKFFWSRKGKKIDIYKVANKLIVISPKKASVYSKLKGIVPVVLISGFIAFLIALYSKLGNLFLSADRVANLAGEKAVTLPEAAEKAASVAVSGGLGAWFWFLVGAIVAIIVFVVWNWKKL